jgi:hypothetical protein
VTSHSEGECLTCVDIAHFRQACAMSWDAVAERLGLTEVRLSTHVWQHRPCGNDLPPSMADDTYAGTIARAADILGCPPGYFRRVYQTVEVARYVIEHGHLPPDAPDVAVTERRSREESYRVKLARERQRSADITRAAKALGMSTRAYRSTHGYSHAHAKAIIAEHEGAA